MRAVVKKYCRYEKLSDVTILEKSNIATWLGGALLAPQVTFTSKEEYHEKG